jgi:hypothetical protein
MVDQPAEILSGKAGTFGRYGQDDKTRRAKLIY